MRGWNFTFVKLLFKLLKKKMHRKTKKDEWKWVLPCSFSGARTVFPQSIQSWCQRGQSRNSGGSSWNDNFSLTCPRCPADNTLLQGSQCSSPALYRYILGQDRERDERRYIQVYGINEQWVGKKKNPGFITSGFYSLFIWIHQCMGAKCTYFAGRTPGVGHTVCTCAGQICWMKCPMNLDGSPTLQHKVNIEWSSTSSTNNCNRRKVMHSHHRGLYWITPPIKQTLPLISQRKRLQNRSIEKAARL